MTDKKISELTNILGSQVDDANDELAIVDSSAGTTNSITRAELLSSVSAMSITGDLTVDTDTLYVDSSNNRVGIGTSSPQDLLHLEDTEPYIRFKDSLANSYARILHGQAGNLDFEIDVDGTDTDPRYRWRVSGSEAMRINSSGNLGVSCTTTPVSTDEFPGLWYQANSYLVAARNGGTPLYSNRQGNDGDAIGLRRDGSNVGSISVTSSSTSYNTSSDERLKENIADAQPASDLIDGIQVREFDWKVDGEHQRYGMVAQELETVAPEAVTKGETEDDMWSVDYSKLVPMLVKEIQDLRKRVNELENTQ